MSLLDDASLIVTPNGYKGGSPNGTLYSVKPTSGAGDMVVTRNTTSTRVNSAGLIQNVAFNAPRLDYPPLGGCPSILVEPARTNKLFESQDISSALWVKSGPPTITTNIALAPDGTTTADGIKADDALTFKIISQTKIVTANSTITSSVFVKKETSQTNFGGFAFIFSGGTTKILRVSVDAVLGTVQFTVGNTLTGTTKVEDYGTYWRISATTTDNGSNTLLQYIYYATLSTNGTNVVQDIGSVRTVWGFQLEVGSYATSYIPTTIAEITRVADVISKTGISSLIGQTEGTLYAEVIIKNTENQICASIQRDSGFNHIFISQFLNKRQFSLRANNVTIFNYNVGVFLSGTNKVALVYNTNGNISAFLNGVKVSTLFTSAFAFSNTLDSLQIFDDGYYSSQNTTNNKSTILFKTALTDGQAISLTTL